MGIFRFCPNCIRTARISCSYNVVFHKDLFHNTFFFVRTDSSPKKIFHISSNNPSFAVNFFSHHRSFSVKPVKSAYHRDFTPHPNLFTFPILECVTLDPELNREINANPEKVRDFARSTPSSASNPFRNLVKNV